MVARTEVQSLMRGLGARDVARLGIAIGCVAFLLALPLGRTIPSRAPWVPLAVGVLAIAAGIWAVSRGTRRLGWLAVAAGLLGIALGALATQASASNLHSVVSWNSLFTTMLIFAMSANIRNTS